MASVSTKGTRKSSRMMTVTKTVTRTGPDGKTVTETVTEEKIVNDDDEFTDLSPQFQLRGFGDKFDKFDKFDKNNELNKNVNKNDKTVNNKDDDTSSSSSSEEEEDQEFTKHQLEALQCHNKYREKHGVNKLKLSKKICQYAQEWADNLAKQDKFQHRSDNKYGENLYTSWSSDKSKVSVKEAVDSWYSEMSSPGYTFGQEPRNSAAGHF